MKKCRSGFTLIELMVVVVLVMILALAIVPTFKEIITKAKYTEGSSAISALRTKVKVFYVENNRLPGVPSSVVANTTSSFVGAMSWCDSTETASQSTNITVTGAHEDTVIVQTLCSKAEDNQWGIANGLTLSRIALADLVGYDAAAADNVNMSGFQDDLDLEVGDYAGAYFKNKDYQYAAFNAGIKSSDYGYVVFAAGSGEKKSPPIGTGYGVMEIRNTSWYENQLLVLTFERYKSLSAQGGETVDSNPLFLTHNAGLSANYVVMPSWFDIVGGQNQLATPGVGGYYTTLDAAGEYLPDTIAFENIGWNAQ